MYISIKFLGLRPRLRGGIVCTKVIDIKLSLRTRHRRFLIVQGGLEIHVQVTAEMDLTERNKALLEKYKQILIVH